MLTLTIPEATPSLNRIAYSGHWIGYYRLKKRWIKLVWAARCQAIQGPPQPLERAKVTIIRHSKRPIQDDDNLKGGLKPLVDALVKNGLIVDDSADRITLQVSQEKPEKVKETQTIVQLEAA